MSSRGKPHYAHFPGTGPAGEACGRCAEFVPSERDHGLRGRCRKVAAMSHVQTKDVARIDASTQACRHWVKPVNKIA